MKSTIALVAIAGFAAAASAQNFSLSINAPTEVTEGAVFTIDVIGDADTGTHMLGGGFSLTSGSGLIADMAWTPAEWSAFNTDNGYAGNGDHAGVIFGQLLIFGIPGFDVPGEGSDLGMSIGSFQVTLGAGSGVIDFALNAGEPFTLQSYDVNDGAVASSADGQLALNGARVTVTPAPSALALLGLGGLAAGRRRR